MGTEVHLPFRRPRRLPEQTSLSRLGGSTDQVAKCIYSWARRARRAGGGRDGGQGPFFLHHFSGKSVIRLFLSHLSLPYGRTINKQTLNTRVRIFEAQHFLLSFGNTKSVEIPFAAVEKRNIPMIILADELKHRSSPNFLRPLPRIMIPTQARVVVYGRRRRMTHVLPLSRNDDPAPVAAGHLLENIA